MLEIDDFKRVGFVLTDDPLYPLTYDLSMPCQADEDEDAPKPALTVDISTGGFVVTDGEMMFIHFNANTPEEAVEWASKITMFEPNF